MRSSADAGDLIDASYAGQYTTVLGIQTTSTLEAAMLMCWKSYYAPHALMMRAERSTMDADQGMSIIIQSLVEADCAGVCYSVDPVRKRRDLVISAAWGLGPGVVDGRWPATPIGSSAPRSTWSNAMSCRNPHASSSGMVPSRSCAGTR